MPNRLIQFGSATTISPKPAGCGVPSPLHSSTVASPGDLVPLSPCQLFGATWHSEFQRLRNGLDQVLASHLTMCLGCVATILLLARIQLGKNSDRALAATGQHAVQMRVHSVSRTEVRAMAPIPNGMAARHAHPRKEVRSPSGMLPTPEHNLCDNHSTDDNRAIGLEIRPTGWHVGPPHHWPIPSSTP